MGTPRAIQRQPHAWLVRAYWALGAGIAVAWWVAMGWGCEPEMHAFVMVGGCLATIADAPMIYVVAREAALGHPVVALLATSSTLLCMHGQAFGTVGVFEASRRVHPVLTLASPVVFLAIGIAWCQLVARCLRIVHRRRAAASLRNVADVF